MPASALQPLLLSFLFVLLVRVASRPASAAPAGSFAGSSVVRCGLSGTIPITRPQPKPKSKPVARTNKAKSAQRATKKAARKFRVTIRKQTRQLKREASANVAKGGKPLGGTVFYLASGHGGPDPGAIGRFGRYLLPEDEYAYDVTIRLAQLLKQQGATVYMMVQDPNDGIRNDAVLKLDNDEIAYPKQRIPLNQAARLGLTTTAVNRLYARHKAAYQRLITIHVDSRSRGQTIDVFFYHHERSTVGRQLARHIHRRFQTNYRRYQPGRPYSGSVSTRNSLYVVRNSHPPTVFIELGNIQNRQDQRRFVIAANRQALANWMTQGILDDYRSRR